MFDVSRPPLNGALRAGGMCCALWLLAVASAGFSVGSSNVGSSSGTWPWIKVVSAAGAAAASEAQDVSDLTCARWADVAATEFGVPARLMQAITRVETARGPRGAWPWTVNAQGRGHWFASREAAVDFVTRALADGSEQVDVGCFQLNLKWHGAAFGSVEAMLDPGRNARYAARFLTHLHAEFGNWTEAAAAYHSRTPEHGRAYLDRLRTALATLPDPVPDGAARRQVPASNKPASTGPRPLLTHISPGPGSLAHSAAPSSRLSHGQARESAPGAMAGASPKDATGRPTHSATNGATNGATDGRGGLLYVRR